jgi:hypothetical protein
MAKLTLATDARGNYRRDIGWKVGEGGKPIQQRFYLGRDRSEAMIRSLRLGTV